MTVTSYGADRETESRYDLSLQLSRARRQREILREERRRETFCWTIIGLGVIALFALVTIAVVTYP